MDPTTPAKRRALAPLNANAMSPVPKLGLKPTVGAGRSPTKGLSGLKRAFQVGSENDNENVIAKKQCYEPARTTSTTTAVESTTDKIVNEPMLHAEPPRARQEPQQQRPRSTSPDASSVFDNSLADTSHDAAEDTALTEPDATPARPRRIMTREEARQNAQILRLRLGLANYKVRTGQTDVPLERLQVRPLPSLRRESSSGMTTAPSSQERAEEMEDASRAEASKDAEVDTAAAAEPVKATSPARSPLPEGRPVPKPTTPTETSVGAASGLLSLARSG
ncbi:hypothetical protein F5X68DRAFT_261600 [Plectosphaerella plurivora]|uniref:Cyclin-dependent kinase n=1 Tax=Plectosphaerella plurivora TaxID=936078 RepID=A0A9P8VC72_9PEZI|nr:hypothetical protein F5X68DRAFT_261600 [Plectosphaerella plurivora]